jgi:predicted aconitase with swiveling domain
MKSFNGRAVLSGNISGESIVSRQGVNLLATYFKGLPAKSPICNDQNNPYLYKKSIGGKILCLPQAIGSTTGGMILQAAADLGIAPIAILYANHIDSLSAAGIILADVWNNRRIVAVDQLGWDFLNYVEDGQTVDIKEDGTVTVQ